MKTAKQVNLDIIRDKSIPSVPKDRQSELEEKSHYSEIAKTVVQGERQNIEERKKYASRIFWLVAGWLISMVIIVVLQGFKLFGFRLSTSVLMALVTSTTAGVLGTLTIVVRYLFSRMSEGISEELNPKKPRSKKLE